MPRKQTLIKHTIRTFRLSETIDRKLQEIHNKIGHSNLIATLIECINTKYNEEFDYVEVARRKLQQNSTPIDKIQAENNLKKARENIKLEQGQVLCQVLDGNEIDIKGIPHCDFITYSETTGKKVRTSSNRSPMDHLNNDDVNSQYRDILGNTGPDAREKLKGLIEQGGLL